MIHRFFLTRREAVLGDPASVDRPQRSDSALEGFRTRIAWGLFSRWVLGNTRITGGAQADAVLTALTVAGAPEHLLPDSKTLVSWASSSPPIPKRSKIEVLDRLAGLTVEICHPITRIAQSLPRHFFSKLVRGGLVDQMLTASRSKHGITVNVLRDRAAAYRPLSAWHLHCDAIDAASWWEDTHEVSWTDIRRTAGVRVQELLLNLWRPGDGTIYQFLPSKLKSRWRTALPIERHRIQSAYERFKPNPFQLHLNAIREPDWQYLKIDRETPHQQVHKLLFAIAADEEFLQDEALSAWSLDMASAGLAAIAVAWTDRYLHFGWRAETNFRSFWNGFDSVFFGRGHMPAIERSVLATMATCGRTKGPEWADSLLRGRQAYQGELRSLSLTFQEVRRHVGRAMEVHPLVYTADLPVSRRDLRSSFTP